ncbi:MAG: radical SAM protein [Nanoarchaeota archaeon]|nr:radical SAM protein [Nanoarchaeota archaeon]
MRYSIARAGVSYVTSILKTKIKPVPISANLFYTRLCNLKCDYCGVIKKMPNKELSLEEWKECSDVLYSLGNRFISITGGEPLIRRDLPDFIKYLSKKPRLISLVTNGTLLTEEKLKEIAKAGVMSIGLSTQSFIPGAHVKSQRTELFDLLLEYQKKYKFEISALITITKKNYKEVPHIVKYLSSLGVRISPNMVTSGKEDYWWFRGNCSHLQFDTKSLPGLIKVIKYLVALKRKGKITYSEDYLWKLIQQSRGDYWWPCEVGKTYLSINSDGKIMPCQDLPPSNIHYRDLKKHYPLKAPQCSGCLWPCYYDEQFKKDHFFKYIRELIKLI